MNEISKNQSKNQVVAIKEQEVLLPIAENYLKMFPEIANDKTFNAKQALLSMALKLSEVKDKTGRSAVDVCTLESITQTAQDVLNKRLDLSKNQAALIVRGNKLMLQVQYQGNVKRALELNPFLSHFTFTPIYQNDEIEIEIDKNGGYNIIKHKTKLQNISNSKIIGGYVRAITKDNKVFGTEVMTIEQIKTAWSMSSNSSLSVHKQFPLKMIRKTILNSYCTWLINTTGEQSFEEVYIQNNTNNEIVDVDFEQDYSEIITDDSDFNDIDKQEVEIVETENENTLTNTPFNDCFFEEMKELEQEKIENENEIEVDYSDYKDNYLPTGEWEQVKNTYNKATHTIKIRKKL